MWTVKLPLGVELSPNNWWKLNMNVYRNANWRTLSAAKIAFTERVLPTLGDIPELGRVLILYSLFTPDKRLVDLNNVISVVDKFFCDTLVKAGKLTDDNVKILPITANRWGGIDTINPRVDAAIHLIGPNTDIYVSDGLQS